MLAKVISGGQTGVDQAALFAARFCGIPTGGWAAKGWQTEDGPAPWLVQYWLVEHQGGYAARTRANAGDSDGTLIVVPRKPLSGGTKLAADAAGGFWKPWLPIDLENPEAEGWPRTVAQWIALHEIRTLNVAGPRESKALGFGKRAEEFLVEVFTALK